MMPEMPTSAFGWDSDVQIQPILPTSAGVELGTDGFGNSRISPKPDVGQKSSEVLIFDL
jgi:hypothetical protein